MSVPQPLPGDLAVLDDLVARLGHVADEASLAAARLQRLNAGDWIGKTATAFGNAASTMPPKLTNASSAFLTGAGAYRSYRTVLADAQLRARSAMGMWADAQSLTSSWQGQLAALPANDPGRNAPDPGAALRTRSEALYDAAVTDVDVAGRAAASSLHSAADAAPHAPSFWARAWHELASFVDGVWDGTVGIVKFAWEMSPIRMMVDPQGWWHDQVNMGKALWWGVHHPVEFGKAITNWDEWVRDPAHAFGELVPNLLLAAATGGTGAAATATREAAGALADTAAALAAKLAAHTRELRLLANDTGSANIDLVTLGTARMVEKLRSSLAISPDVEREFTRQAAVYGKGGTRLLPDGRLRFSSRLSPARTPGLMVGRRRVREWDPITGRKREWMETIDHSGRVRIVRPNHGPDKIHHVFDRDGRYIGRREDGTFPR